jgi:type 1 glutamine amidotransferase
LNIRFLNTADVGDWVALESTVKQGPILKKGPVIAFNIPWELCMFDVINKLKHSLFAVPLIVSLLFPLPSMSEEATTDRINILVWTATDKWGGNPNGVLWRHKSVAAAVTMWNQLAAENGWLVTNSEDRNYVMSALDNYDIFVCNNCVGDVFDTAALETKFEKWMAAGGNFLGIHSVLDAEYPADTSTQAFNNQGLKNGTKSHSIWPYYGDLISGAFFDGHPATQTATVKQVTKHYLTDFLGSSESFNDEWYNQTGHPTDDPLVTCLLEVDETSYEGGEEGFHCVTWIKSMPAGGDVFITGLGHTDQAYSDNRFRTLIKNAVAHLSGPHRIDG